MRRGRLNLLLFGLALGLGLAALLLPDPQGGQPPPAVGLDPASIERIEARFPRGGEPLRLERRDGRWWLTAPVAREARSGRVVRLLGSLRERTGSCYPAAEHEPAEFGLAPPRAVLVLDGRRVEFGDRAGDGRRYLHADGRLCLVEDIVVPMLRGGADTLAPPDSGD